VPLLPRPWVPVFIAAIAWVVGCALATRLMRRCGLSDRCSRWSLAAVLSTSVLVASVHVTALLTMAIGTPLVIPGVIVVCYTVMLTAAVLLFGRLLQTDSTRSTDSTAAPNATPRLRALFSRGWWLPAGLLCAVYVVFLIDAATRFPTGWDGVHYHLPTAVRWVQQGSLGLVPNDRNTNYPANGMILPYLLLTCDLQRLTSVVMVPQGILLAMLVWAIGRRLGIPRRARLLSTCVVMSIPIVMFQTFSSYVDLFGTTTWLAALLALMWASRSPPGGQRFSLVVIAGLAMGLAAGSKMTYLIVGALLVPVVLMLAMMSEHHERRTWRPALKLTAVFCAASCVCGSFWYVRNVVQTGNPFFPLGLSVAGVTVFDGIDPDSFFPERSTAAVLARWLPYPWLEQRPTGYNFGVGNGMGAAFTTFVPVGLIAFLLSPLTRRPRTPADRWRWPVLLLIVIGTLLFFTLLQQTIRFVLPFIVLATMCSLASARDFLLRRPRWSLAIASVSIAVTGTVAALLPAKNALGRVRDHVWSRDVFYEIPSVVDRLPPGSTVVNVNARTKNFALQGSAFTNHVVSPQHWINLTTAGRSIAHALRQLHADYLFVAGDAWKQWPDDLGVTLVYDSTKHSDRVGPQPVRLYKVRRVPQSTAKTADLRSDLPDALTLSQAQP